MKKNINPFELWKINCGLLKYFEEQQKKLFFIYLFINQINQYILPISEDYYFLTLLFLFINIKQSCLIHKWSETWNYLALFMFTTKSI